MIYDRTQADVDNAKLIIGEKVHNFIDLTPEEEETLEKGTVTVSTLNRIEDKQQELKSLMAGIGYYSADIESKSWEESDIFDETDLDRLIANLDILRYAFFVYSDTPTTPMPSYHYETMNAAEKILHDLDVMINDVCSNYRECGAAESGEDI